MLSKFTFTRPLLDWYRQRGPHTPVPGRGSSDAYAIWVAEIMLQQTQVKTVGPYYDRWLDRYPDTRSLAAAQLDEVLKLWEGLGYYSRARNLHKAAQFVETELQGKLPKKFEDWLQLPGVGPYTAAAVASIAFGEDVAAVDGNVLRVYAHFTALDKSIDHQHVKSAMKVELESVLDLPGDFNQALMDLGREVCTPKEPLCGQCPLQKACKAYGSGKQAELPIRKSRKKTPEYRIVAGVIYREGKVLIQQRRPEGLLGGLWEFPGGKVEPGEALHTALEREILEETGLSVKVEDELATIRHAYTHFRIHMTAFKCSYQRGEVDLRAATQAKWVRPGEFEHYAFPKANHKIFGVMNIGMGES